MPATALESPSLWSDEEAGRPDAGAGGPGAGGPGRGDGGSGGAGGRRGRPRGPRRHVPLAVLLVTSAVLGGGASTGILALAGAFDDTGAPATTVVAPSTSPTSAATAGSDGGALDAE